MWRSGRRGAFSAAGAGEGFPARRPCYPLAADPASGVGRRQCPADAGLASPGCPRPCREGAGSRSPPPPAGAEGWRENRRALRAIQPPGSRRPPPAGRRTGLPPGGRRRRGAALRRRPADGTCPARSRRRLWADCSAPARQLHRPRLRTRTGSRHRASSHGTPPASQVGSRILAALSRDSAVPVAGSGAGALVPVLVLVPSALLGLPPPAPAPAALPGCHTDPCGAALSRGPAAGWSGWCPAGLGGAARRVSGEGASFVPLLPGNGFGRHRWRG